MTESVRRSQAERRATTRAQLLEGAVECLVERGYAGTTLAQVAARAGLSNGAVWLHFRSKATLMADAGLLCGERVTQGVATVDPSSSPEKRVTGAIELLWSRCQDPTFQALIELVRAGRTDPELRVAMQATDERASNLFFDTLAVAVGPDIAAGPGFRRNARLIGLALYGTAVTAGLRSALGERRLLAEMQSLAAELLLPGEEAACG
jgi:AcrR family transcriptional regulator